MRDPTLERKGFYKEIARALEDYLGESIVGALIFGSTVYAGSGRDIDILVIVDEDLDVKSKIRLEHSISRKLSSFFKNSIFDVHVMSTGEFRENLKPGSFLSGLALGYQVLIDKAGIEEYVLEFLKTLSREKLVLHNKYGSWDLSFHASVLYNIKSKRRRLGFIER